MSKKKKVNIVDDKSYIYRTNFDKFLKLMKKGAKKLLGTNDFSTFRSSSCNAKSPIRTIKSIKIKEVKNIVDFYKIASGDIRFKHLIKKITNKICEFFIKT